MGGNTDGIVPIRMVGGLPFITVEVSANTRSLTLHNVLLDTGSVSCAFSADTLLEINVKPSLTDSLRVLVGIGGREYGFSKVLDGLKIGDLSVQSFEVEVTAMDYGFDLDGIIGMNFLRVTKAKIDCERLVLTKWQGCITAGSVSSKIRR